MKKGIRFSVLFLIILTAAACTTSTGITGGTDALDRQDQADEILKVGVLLPQSGQFQMYGVDFLEGIDCFFENRNRIVNESSPEIELVYYDNNSTEEGTRKGCRELIDTHNVDIILGPLTSGNSRLAIDLCSEKKVPVMPLWATADDLVASSAYACRIVYSNTYTGFLIGKFSVENLRSKKAAVVLSLIHI